MSRFPIRVSAPGKVLIAGGYLVLEPENVGLVLASKARFTTSIDAVPKEKNAWWIQHANLLKEEEEEEEEEEEGKDKKTNDREKVLYIRVESPQLKTGWTYKWQGKAQSLESIPMPGLTAESTCVSVKNPYIENTLRYCLKSMMLMSSPELYDKLIDCKLMLQVNVSGDDDFYSQRKRTFSTSLDKAQVRTGHENENKQRSCASSSPLHLWSSDGCATPRLAKTGLGSSAALITSLVAALVCFFLDKKLPSEEQSFVPQEEDKTFEVQTSPFLTLRLIHNLAQICHSLAQGKVGSGFDISTACYGSQCYTRFNPTLIEQALDVEATNEDLLSIINDVNRAWINRMKPFDLPKGLHLMLGDICGGSSTVSMVKKVWEWRQLDPDNYLRIWHLLRDANSTFVDNFFLLCQRWDRCSYERVIQGDSTRKWESTNEPIHQLVGVIQNTFLSIRSLLKEMGEKAGAPIEPDVHTELADLTMQIPGVLIAGVPGAGGEDALFAIVLHPDVIKKVQDAWQKWNQEHVASYQVVPLCHGVTSEDETIRGVRMEKW